MGGRRNGPVSCTRGGTVAHVWCRCGCVVFCIYDVGLYCVCLYLDLLVCLYLLCVFVCYSDCILLLYARVSGMLVVE